MNVWWIRLSTGALGRSAGAQLITSQGVLLPIHNFFFDSQRRNRPKKIGAVLCIGVEAVLGYELGKELCEVGREATINRKKSVVVELYALREGGGQRRGVRRRGGSHHLDTIPVLLGVDGLGIGVDGLGIGVDGLGIGALGNEKGMVWCPRVHW